MHSGAGECVQCYASTQDGEGVGCIAYLLSCTTHNVTLLLFMGVVHERHRFVNSPLAVFPDATCCRLPSPSPQPHTLTLLSLSLSHLLFFWICFFVCVCVCVSTRLRARRCNTPPNMPDTHTDPPTHTDPHTHGRLLPPQSRLALEPLRTTSPR